MADIVTANLAGANKKFNSLISKFDTIKSDLLAGLETEASTLASTLSGDLTAITGDLRGLMPAVPALPDINLQAGLASLSGLTVGSARHTAPITTGSTTVKVNGLGCGRIGDALTACTSVAAGSSNVFAGP